MIKNETLSQSDCYMYISVRDYVNWTPIKARYTLATKSTVSATKSTAINCRIQVVADLLPIPVKKVDRIGNKVDVSATVDFVADLLPVSATVDFQQSRPC